MLNIMWICTVIVASATGKLDWVPYTHIMEEHITKKSLAYNESIPSLYTVRKTMFVAQQVGKHLVHLSN